MAVGIDDIIIASAVTSVASSVLKRPIETFLATVVPTFDLPMRTLMTAASNNLIPLADLEATSEFRRLDEDTKAAIRIIVDNQQKRLKEEMISKSVLELGKNADKAISEIDKEYYDPLFKKLDKIKKELDDIEYDNLVMEQKIFEEMAKVDVSTLKAEITKLYKELTTALAAPT